MGLFEAQGQNAAGSHPLSEWCDKNAIDLSIKSFEQAKEEQHAWNMLITGKIACASDSNLVITEAETEIRSCSGSTVEPEVPALD